MSTLDTSSLKATFVSSNTNSEWCTLGVVIGLLIEFGVLLYYSKEMLRSEKVWLILANFLIVAGVGGEYIFEGRAAAAASQLQRISEEKIATINGIAANALLQAAKLGVTAKNLSRYVQDLEGKDQNLNLEVSHLGIRSTSLENSIEAQRKNDDAIILSLKVEQKKLDSARINALTSAEKAIKSANIARNAEEKTIAELEAERIVRQQLQAALSNVTPRIINQQAEQAMAEFLSQSLKDISVDIISFESLGSDVAPLSREIYSILIADGANVEVFTPLGGSGLFQGVIVQTSQDAPDNIKNAAVSLLKALGNAGIESALSPSFPQNEQLKIAYSGPTGGMKAKIRIFIGAKPYKQ